MDEDFEKSLKEALAAAPRIPGVNWNTALSVSILRTLEKQQPGFRQAVRTTVLRAAESMASSDDADWIADAPSMFKLADSWIFTETLPAADDPAAG